MINYLSSGTTLAFNFHVDSKSPFEAYRRRLKDDLRGKMTGGWRKLYNGALHQILPYQIKEDENGHC
jgi:hypothetical protein